MENEMNEPNPLMTIDELAALLRLNRDTTYKAAAERKIPGVRKIGRTIRIHRQSVMAWLEQGESPAVTERRP